MKRIIAVILLLICAFSTCVLASCSEKNTVSIGDETLTLPIQADKISFSTPADTELFCTVDGTQYNIYSASLEELRALSQHSIDTKYTDIPDKQTAAELSAALFAEYYPEKEVVYDGMTVDVTLNPVAKCIICNAKGNDGGVAALAIEKKSGEIVMLFYGQ